MDQKRGGDDQRVEGDDFDWYQASYPTFPSSQPMPPENNQFVFPASLSVPENRHPNQPFQLPQPQINPYHPIASRKTAFYGNPSFPNTAYDPAIEVDFSRLNLSNTPSRQSYGLGFDRSILQSNSLFDSALNMGFSPIANNNGQLDYSDFNLQRMRVDSAVRGQTGLYMEPHGYSGLGHQENLQGFVPNGLNPNSPSYNNFHNNNGGGRNLVTTTNRSWHRANQNGFQPTYEMGNGAPTGSIRNGFRVDSGFRRRARPGPGSVEDGSCVLMPSGYNNNGNHVNTLSERLNMIPFEELRGRMVMLAKDQHGYALLKKKIEEGKEEEVEMIFLELKDHVRELMMDQYGNYPIQKIFEVCSPDQMTQMLLLVASDEHYLMSICVDTHGTRAMQKLLEHLTTPDQISLVMSVLSRNAVSLTKSMTGYRVIERCLKSFTSDDIRHLLYVVADNCAEIAMDQAGCCVLQQCVLHAEGEPKQRLIAEIISNSLVLSENLYGNYVVQFILGMRVPHFTERIMAQLTGSYVSLSMNKYGSNVVEKCLKDAGEEQATQIIKEIINSPNFLMVLQDPFGNYVTQTALDLSKGTLRHTMVSLIQFHYPYLHSHPHGKRVLAKTRGGGKHRMYESKR